jgi:hypothetical protein
MITLQRTKPYKDKDKEEEDVGGNKTESIAADMGTTQSLCGCIAKADKSSEMIYSESRRCVCYMDRCIMIHLRYQMFLQVTDTAQNPSTIVEKPTGMERVHPVHHRMPAVEKVQYHLLVRFLHILLPSLLRPALLGLWHLPRLCVISISEHEL